MISKSQEIKELKQEIKRLQDLLNKTLKELVKVYKINENLKNPC